MDFGVSSYQIDSSKRGFSYQFDAPLDMRFDLNYDKTAFNVLNDYNEKSISNIIKHNGEERNYKKIAKIIVQYSKKGTMNTSFDLKNAIIKASPYRKNINKMCEVLKANKIDIIATESTSIYIKIIGYKCENISKYTKYIKCLMAE